MCLRGLKAKGISSDYGPCQGRYKTFYKQSNFPLNMIELWLLTETERVLAMLIWRFCWMPEHSMRPLLSSGIKKMNWQVLQKFHIIFCICLWFATVLRGDSRATESVWESRTEFKTISRLQTSAKIHGLSPHWRGRTALNWLLTDIFWACTSRISGSGLDQSYCLKQKWNRKR